MILRPVLSGLICMGFVACAGAETEEITPQQSYTVADVNAAPDAWRTADPENLVIMETSKGQIILELLPIVAPQHADQFRHYVRAGLYDNTPFHRVIKGFMAQGGDIRQTHGPDKMLPEMDGQFTFRRTLDEFAINPVGPADSAKAGLHKGFAIRTVAQFMSEMSMDGKVETWMPHCAGVLSTARTDNPNSANAQFFLISDEGRHLDKEYTAKGRVVVGMDVVTSIKIGPASSGTPIPNPDLVLTAIMAADIPDAERPTVYIQRTDTADWSALLDAADKNDQDICDLPTAAAVVE